MPVVDRIALERASANSRTGYRTVFVLHDVEGHEHEEISRSGVLGRHSKSQLPRRG